MDFNNDGLADLIVGERNGYVNFYRRLGNGSLTSEGRIQAGSSDLDVGNNSAPFVFDWNNDGLLDLIVGREYTSGGSLRLYLNQGTPENAVFSGYTPVMKGSSPVAYPRSVPHMEDMNGDGLLDLLVGEDYGHTYYLENSGSTGAPVFTSGTAITVNGSPFAWPNGQTDCTVYVNDWNEDGVLDIIQGNYVKNVWVFLGNDVGIENFNSQEVSAGVLLSLHTNPISNSLGYTVTSEQPLPVSVSLWSMNGRLVKQWDLGTLQGVSDHVHTVSDLPNGVYAMIISVNGENSTRQVAVIR
ncbi:MAG: T9SS type A sorting domain-containing protein [Candidatus Sabulitectum sp.]|nr:T9SS type A sorting domain-containing protein [Candidatus Sabulitectum sp.]